VRAEFQPPADSEKDPSMALEIRLPAQDAGEFLSIARRSGVLVFGTGSYARALSAALREAGVSPRAFVVSSRSAEAMDGLPVFSLNELGAESEYRHLPLWVGVYNHRAQSDYTVIAAQCKAAGMETVVFPQAYFETVSQHLGWRYWLTDRENYRRHGDALQETYAELDDEQSRLQFEAAIAFRLGHSPERAPQPAREPHYFPGFPASEVAQDAYFVDGGAYDGDTLEAASRHLRLRGAYAFEPDLDNFSKLAARSAGFAFPVTCFPCGLSSRTRSLNFSAGQGGASAIGDEGGGRIQAARLDECLPNLPVTYLKLDVEGHEIEALAGAVNTLRRNRPILAIAGYHRWDDLWQIPRFIRELELGYRLRFRIHAHNTFDSVFYAY